MMDVRQLIEYASRCKLSAMSRDVHGRLASFTDSMNLAHTGCGDHPLNIFSFHVSVTGSEAVIDKVDVQRDNRSYDYQAMAEHLVWSAEAFCKGPPVCFVTDLQGGAAFGVSENLCLVPLALRRDAIMFERVLTMCAYVHSEAFDRDTAFLDTDAFPNANLAEVFDGTFDVAVTYRLDPDLMPLNEGVIFASHSNKAAVQRFFVDYMRTFETLCEDETVGRYYGDIKGWRGGQLSLNALALPAGWQGGEMSDVRDGVRLRLLPCDQFNFTPEEAFSPQNLAGAVLDEKMIIHLKGKTKKYFPIVETYQLKKAQTQQAACFDPGEKLQCK